ncbi:MAG: hypothetical protein ABSB95_00335 [Dissulfurispiraceae bacterium]
MNFKVIHILAKVTQNYGYPWSPSLISLVIDILCRRQIEEVAMLKAF